jgi:uncharacterized membrane protein (DUF4010 family)
VSQETTVLSFAVALGIGMLIGAERERHKGQGPRRAAAGVRTHAISALLGASAFVTGGHLLLGIATAGVIAFTAIAYWRSSGDDPGLTSEIALVLTVTLGGLAPQRPEVAGACAVVVTGLLALRRPLQRFVTETLTETELNHALILAACTLVALPLLPNRPIDPFGVLNPHAIWKVVIVVMTISAAGYVAVRALGSRWGLPLTGLASGFVSSTGTIAAMAARAAAHPEQLAGAASGAVLSTVATVVQLAFVLAVLSWPTFVTMSLPLLCAVAAALIYGAFGLHNALRVPGELVPISGEPFSLKLAILFGAVLSAVSLVSAGLHQWLGATGLVIGSIVSGFADTHSASASVASFVATGRLSASEAVLPILGAFLANTLSKVIAASINGNRAFMVRVVPGLMLVAAAFLAGTWMSGWGGHP